MSAVAPATARAARWLQPALRYTVLVVVGLLMLYPLFWMVGGAFKPNHEIFGSIGFIPQDPTLEGVREGWRTSTEYSFATYLANTFRIVIPKVIVTVISSVLVAFGFARFNVPGKKLLFAALIATVLLPKSVLLIPQYLMFRELGWLDTFLPLYVPSAFATEGFFVFLIIQFMRGLPRELEEAAVIDGCNSLQVLWHVVVPLLVPAMIAVALFQFMWTMNDFIGPLVYLSSVEHYPVSLALKMSIDVTEATSWNQILAMSTIALMPSLILFFLAQKYFVEGTTAGAVKG
ncbi:carbohydrate ABC transporter permease [Coralloluteibacterium stylophorae]|uniref:Carbohydrate ABC transporter permease n=1 Tax=Coralloluteibacterium stylophorae TaxID=1776034 RepID=A0A8J8AW73_9GAMM|nr:carbohydrate ABC transporter permease [Coralloluteibacterium stylophorae]MBS7458176.1 carbohydrate ABC transporter permease [Coralloluteibacterium stylophorae]